jgi:hypothetical protein
MELSFPACCGGITLGELTSTFVTGSIPAGALILRAVVERIGALVYIARTRSDPCA